MPPQILTSVCYSLDVSIVILWFRVKSLDSGESMGDRMLPLLACLVAGITHVPIHQKHITVMTHAPVVLVMRRMNSRSANISGYLPVKAKL